MSTRSPYVRRRLLEAVTGLHKDAETARNRLDAARQDVAEALEILAEAEAQERRAAAEVDSIGRGIAWLEREAEHLAADPDADPAAKLRATGLMRHEPKPVDPAPGSATLYQDNGLPMIWDASVPPGGYVCAATDGDGICGMPVESEPCDQHGPDSVPPAPRGLPPTPPVPHEPLRIDTVHTSGTGAGQLVATSGPTVTMPDTGLNPDPLPPAPPTAEPRHAKDRPGLLARLTGGHRIVHDEQDGDDQ